MAAALGTCLAWRSCTYVRTIGRRRRGILPSLRHRCYGGGGKRSWGCSGAGRIGAGRIGAGRIGAGRIGAGRRMVSGVGSGVTPRRISLHRTGTFLSTHTRKMKIVWGHRVTRRWVRQVAICGCSPHFKVHLRVLSIIWPQSAGAISRPCTIRGGHFAILVRLLGGRLRAVGCTIARLVRRLHVFHGKRRVGWVLHRWVSFDRSSRGSRVPGRRGLAGGFGGHRILCRTGTLGRVAVRASLHA